MPEHQVRDSRLIMIVTLTVIAGVLMLIQRTSVAPFPHGADDFIGGFAVGAAIASVFAWLGSRR